MEDEYDVANLIVGRLIGCKVCFKKYEEEIYVNEYITVILSENVSMSISGDSVFTIGFTKNSLIPDISFDIFNINPRAKELSMKIDDIVDKGKVVVNSDLSCVKIIVVVEESSYDGIDFSGTIGIKIEIPRWKDYSYSPQYEYDYEEEKDKTVENAFKIGALAVGAVLVGKIIKGGIGAIIGGPIGAAIGFAT